MITGKVKRVSDEDQQRRANLLISKLRESAIRIKREGQSSAWAELENN